MSIFIGQPIYSLKDICLGGDTVEKPVIFEGQEGVLIKRVAWKAKSESSTASIQRLSPLGMPFLTFIGQPCASLLPPRSSQMCLLFLVRPTRGRSMGDVLSPQSFGLRPPTGGYDSSDLLRRSQTMCIRNMDTSSDLLRRSQTTCFRNMDPSYHLLRRSQQMTMTFRSQA